MLQVVDTSIIICSETITKSFARNRGILVTCGAYWSTGSFNVFRRRHLLFMETGSVELRKNHEGRNSLYDWLDLTYLVYYCVIKSDPAASVESASTSTCTAMLDLVQSYPFSHVMFPKWRSPFHRRKIPNGYRLTVTLNNNLIQAGWFDDTMQFSQEHFHTFLCV